MEIVSKKPAEGESAYARQLLAGFGNLRFTATLEDEFRDQQRHINVKLLRTSLLVGLCLWLLFGVSDWLMAPSELFIPMLVVRVLVAVPMLGLGYLLWRGRDLLLLTPMTMLSLVLVGLGASAVVGLGHSRDIHYPYEGLLLVCMAGFFLAGLRLNEALLCAAVTLLGFTAFEVWAGLPMGMLLANLLFLLSGNVIGAVGCYLLEYKTREQFLTLRLNRELAEQDALTGLSNRRSFDAHLETLWQQAERDGRGLSVLLCDVDHFKSYNDHYGHAAGDLVLQRIAEVLQEAARRPLDMAARVGGEEFAVLLYDTEPADAQRLGCVLVEGVKGLGISHALSQTSQSVTVSVGLASRQHEQPQDNAQALLAQADRALYRAKDSGRDQLQRI
ncbi:GGDEF domain-containing protein [Atopomonas hussainii]|uniref:GGDEF domain-containing protein n=1 Tax=Atopomonas hussainii TaxID=1429083 RepID=UPI0008FFE549|nr:diguanylate cyclase [Atopomonas hussainii]